VATDVISTRRDAVAGKQKDPYDEGRSLREEVAYARLVAELAYMQVWWNRDRRKPGVIPRDAAGIKATAPGRRSKLTLKLDAEVVKWFRAMGLGYQARMNYALRSWMLSVVTREIAAGEGRR
jgi:uncharacterized protein (DUF4415 family)